MRISRSAAALAAVAVICSVTLAAGTAQAADPVVSCKRAINKANGAYFAALQKLIEKCKIGVITKGVPATLLGCTISAIDASFAPGKVTAARLKADATIAGGCGGADKNCATAGDNVALASVGWGVGICMNFENGSCNTPVTSCSDIRPCITCIADAATDQAENELLADKFNSASFFPNAGTEPNKTRNKCQITIFKAAGKFLQAKTKIMNKCWDAKHNDPLNAKGFGDGTQCPDTAPDNKTALAIQKEEQKKIAAICKACGGGGDADKNNLCDTTPPDPLSTIIDTPFSCNSVIVPATAVNNGMTENCGAITVTNLQSYINCIDCVLEYKVDCMTDAGQGDGNGMAGDGNGGTNGTDYASECNSPCGNGMIDAGEDCEPPGAPGVCPGAGNGLQNCSATCTCSCPERIEFEGTATDALTELDAGWTGIAHDSKIVSEGKVTVDVTQCDNGTPGIPGDDEKRRNPICGICTFTGPLQNSAANAGDLDVQRCRNDTSVKCTSNGQCAGVGNACIFVFGAPLPLSSGGVSTCVTNEIGGNITGTANVESGESSSTLSLTSRVHTGVTTAKPCPKCTDAGGLNDGATGGGTCTDGPRAGLACDANAESPIPAFGRTSLDCPPDPLSNVANLSITLKNSTDTETRTLSAASPNCTANGFTGLKCFCDTCANLAATSCASNADCPGGVTCGGLRCLVDSGGAAGTACSPEGQNTAAACGTVTAGVCDVGVTDVCIGGAHVGLACVSDSDCADASCNYNDMAMTGTCIAGPHTGDACQTDTECAGTCGRPGEATKPNSCTTNCVAGGGGGGDDGMCNPGPSDTICSLETFRSCGGNVNCRPPAEGGTCADCAPGLQTCITKRRECYRDNGAIAGSTQATGLENTPVADTSTPTLASLFCIAPTSSSAVNNVAGLPGLGRLKLKGTARGLP